MTQQITIELDDALYQPLVKQIGEENLNDFFVKLIEPYLLLSNFETNPKVSDKAGADKDSILGFSQGSIKILDDIIAPTTTDNDCDACQ